MTPPILITGCARSGTSLTAGVVDICGGFGGNLCGPTNANKKGQFENRAVVNFAVKPFLRAIGADPMGQYPLPDINHIIIQKGDAEFWRKKILRIFEVHGLTEHRRWYYKGAKMCLMWPLWHRAFPEARWIWVVRDSEGIVNSCMKTSFMHAFDNKAGWNWWIDQHNLRLKEMINAPGLDLITTHPSKMIEGDFSEMKAAIQCLELTWRDRQVRDFITPNLWHFKEGRKNE